jgi:hypothetical protein
MSGYQAGKDAANGALEIVREVHDALSRAGAYAGQTSLIDVTKHARVEPRMIVDAILLSYPYMEDISQSMQALFAGYYLQAVEMTSSINGIKVADKLAPLNPNRTLDISMLSYSNGIYSAPADDWRMRASSYTHSLPTKANRSGLGMENYSEKFAASGWSISMEADKVPKTEEELRGEIERLSKQNDKLRDKTSSANMVDGATVVKDSTKMITELTNLSVGKLYDVSFKEGKETANVKIAIRVMAMTIPSHSLASIFSYKSIQDTSIKERFHGVMSGELSMIGDFIFCNDLVDAHRRNLAEDKTGLYREIMARKDKSLAAGLLERNPSLNVASTLAVIDSTTAESIEDRMGGELKNFKIRSRVFDTTAMMILAVVDRGYDRVRFYHRGIPQFTEVSIKDIKAGNKGNGTDVSEILKSFLAGSAPRL